VLRKCRIERKKDISQERNKRIGHEGIHNEIENVIFSLQQKQYNHAKSGKRIPRILEIFYRLQQKVIYQAVNNYITD
jgi:hypothetical protein